MRMIKLSRWNGDEVWVNCEHINFIERGSLYTRIFFSVSGSLEVRDTPEMILRASDKELMDSKPIKTRVGQSPAVNNQQSSLLGGL